MGGDGSSFWTRAAEVVTCSEGDCLLLAAVRDGCVRLEDAVSLRGTARALWEETSPSVTLDAAVALLLQHGASAEAAPADALSWARSLAQRSLLSGPSPGGSPASPSLPHPGLARRTLEAGYRLRFTARGQSMRPQLADGSVLEVVPQDAAAARAGDVLLYLVEGRLVAHRLVGRRDGVLLARGDSAARLDRVSEKDVLGLVVARIVPGAEGEQRIPLSSGWRRILGMISGPLWRLLAGAARVLVVVPLRTAPPLRHGAGAMARVASGVLRRMEGVASRLRRRLDVVRSALLSGSEKDALRARLYRRHAVREFTALDENVAAGLTLIEEVLLARHPPAAGPILVVGCGPGRECFALARRGFDVTGLDRDSGMLARARSRGAAEGLAVRFLEGEATGPLPEGPFDTVVVFSGLMNMLLPRARRVAMLRACRDVLAPAGRVLVTFLSDYVPEGALPPAGARTFLQAVNPEHETGDLWLLNEAVHVFPHPDGLVSEAAEAGLAVADLFRDQRAYDRQTRQVRGYAVLERAPES